MEESILQFAKQFDFAPMMAYAENHKVRHKFCIAGMGGSHLGADILKMHSPYLHIHIHSDYGLPEMPDAEADATTFIAMSYSGNTEEILDFAKKAVDERLHLVVITSGGALLDYAQQHDIPYVQMPATKMQPRMALGFQLLALAHVVQPALIPEIQELYGLLQPETLRTHGEDLAMRLRGRIPVIYASQKNAALAQLAKIKLNETAKVPAFYNSFPELNHNEMAGFDTVSSTRSLSRDITIVMIEDANDHPRIHDRFAATKSAYYARGIDIVDIDVFGKTRFQRIFTILLLVDWAAFSLAAYYGTEPEAVPIIEQLKADLRD